MRRVVTLFAAAVAVLAAFLPARAQSLEVSGLAGFTPSVGLENRAPELSGLDIGAGLSWGLQFGQFFTPRWGVEMLMMRQDADLNVATDAGSADLFTMTVRQVHGNVVYQLGSTDARLRPFVFGGLGATFFRADHLNSETKFSFGLGGGVKYFRRSGIGFRGHFRYKPTMLSDEDAGRFCDPFGFCQGTLSQVELAGGVVVRF